MGTLRIHGIIDIVQFWPTGSADADTTKIKLTVKEDSFEYKKDNEKKFTPTRIFQGAISKGQGSKPVINTSTRTGIQTITVRLQGVDAPELHYRAAPLKKATDVSETLRVKFNSLNEERRQCFAESATVALSGHLKPFADKNGFIQAYFESRVDHPYEVIDTYGRFIGNIFISKHHDVNLWLIVNGWGTPAFYTSMSEDEIQRILEAWKTGKTKPGRTSKAITKNANLFDKGLIYRQLKPTETFKIGDDKGKVLMPKIFRRQNAWMVLKEAGVISGSMSFKTYLKKAPDQLVTLEDFLENGIHSATVYCLHDFINTGNKVAKSPEELVFKEKPGTLLDSKGKKVTFW